MNFLKIDKTTCKPQKNFKKIEDYKESLWQKFKMEIFNNLKSNQYLTIDLITILKE